MNNRTPSNVTVTVLDLAEQCEKARELLQSNENIKAKSEKRPARKVTSVDVGGSDYGFIKTEKGVFVLNRDGVGTTAPVTVNNRFPIGFYGTWQEEGSEDTAIDMLPALSLSVDPEKLGALKVKPAEQLEDFIRVFGRRLEINYIEWKEFLAK